MRTASCLNVYVVVAKAKETPETRSWIPEARHRNQDLESCFLWLWLLGKERGSGGVFLGSVFLFDSHFGRAGDPRLFVPSSLPSFRCLPSPLALTCHARAHAIQPCASNSTKHSTANAVSVNLNIQCRLFGGCKHAAASKRPGRRRETGILRCFGRSVCGAES